MGALQSRLDAEFLLAHMCSVKFKEWVVVLATLLRRSEVQFTSSKYLSEFIASLLFMLDKYLSLDFGTGSF